MPQFTQPNPTGLDWYIQTLQARMYSYFKTLWSLVDDTKWNCFPRAYRNFSKEQNGYIPQYFIVSDTNTTNDYAGSDALSGGAIFYNDNYSVVSFFGLGDPERKNDTRDDVAKVQLMFFIDLSKITPGGIPLNQQHGQRLDEVVINDMRNFMLCNGCCFTITDTYRDVDKVLEKYSGAVKKSELQNDMHPKFCFRLDMEIRYNPFQNVPKNYN